MSQKQVTHIGVDYGSKLAGTTVVCYESKPGLIDFLQSLKKQDADKLILDFVDNYTVDYVFIDAPLSLPAVYQETNSDGNYFYRAADKITKAMSPMFIGGLTARAMKLNAHLSRSNTIALETYPKMLVSELGYGEDYKSEIDSFLKQILNQYSLRLNQPMTNWHQVDSLLAYLSGVRYFNYEHKEVGDKNEGTIIY